ncbi:MAG: dTDP-glucose 4,6-dehydratase, partial [Thermoprotei archaeon]
SINEPAPFLKTNILGIFNILETARRLEIPLVVHISTDEVYGDLWGREPVDEEAPFKPSSPYSASKASGDLLCQSYWRTYKLPVIIVRPSNNYGPYQYPEKFIPKIIIRALHDKPIPVYGRGDQVRDWLYVEDFAEALDTVINKGSRGEAYNIPGFNERRNLEVAETILELMGKPLSLIKHVEDRPGHDRRYAMRGDKILALGWKPKTPWVKGLEKTIKWYLTNEWWWKPLLSDNYFQLDTPWKKR